MATQTATLANGCFWCTEAVFKRLKGVSTVMPGYAGGHVAHPSYEEVTTGTTGHAEAIQIEFDPDSIPFARILDVFFATHDPTTLNRQGHDIGEQYRSAIFFHDDEQRRVAEQTIKRLTEEKVYDDPIVTQVVPFEKFYPAEDYHRDYYAHHRLQPYCIMVINPKLAKLRKQFREYLGE